MRLGDDKVVVDSIVGDVEGLHAIVLDDEIATGGSILEIVKRLSDSGAVSASIAATHGLFTGNAVERLSNCEGISEIVVTNTVPAPADFPKLISLTVGGLFAEAIQRIHAGKSVSKLFHGVDPQYAPPPPSEELF